MDHVRRLSWSIAFDEDGQALVEYALIIAAVAVVCVVIVSAIGLSVSSMLSNVTTLFP